MAVTHADLAPSPKSFELGSKTGSILMALSILFGLFCFILSLIAEATRSEVIWMPTSERGEKYECAYSGSGKIPLLCAAGAFLGLAIAIVMEHTYMMIAVSKSPALVTWDPYSVPVNTLTWQAGFFFIATWICFAVGEILLLIGLSVESGHLKNWSAPRQSCLTIRQGLFATSGLFALITVFLAAGLYLTALRAQRLIQGQQMVQRQMLEASVLYASPPRSPPHQITTVPHENPIVRTQDQNHRTLSDYLYDFNKHSNVIV